MCVFPYIRADFVTCPSNPFTWRCVSARSRCGAERIYNLAVQPQTGIVRVDVRFSVDPDPCKLSTCIFNPFTWCCVSAHSRCGAEQLSRATPNRDRACRCALFRGSVQTFYLHFQPFHVALRVGALPLRCGPHLQLSRATPNRDRACRCAFFRGSVFHVALRVGALPLWCGAYRRCVSRVLEVFLTSSMNPLWGSCGSKRWSRAPEDCKRDLTHPHSVSYIRTAQLWKTVNALNAVCSGLETGVYRQSMRKAVPTKRIHTACHIWLRPSGPPPLPPPWYPVMYSYTSISNGRHGVFSPPPPVEQDIPPAVLSCGTGYPSASAASPCIWGGLGGHTIGGGGPRTHRAQPYIRTPQLRETVNANAVYAESSSGGLAWKLLFWSTNLVCGNLFL